MTPRSNATLERGGPNCAGCALVVGGEGRPGVEGRIAGPVDLPATWHSRGYVPHFDMPHLVQHVTYRLADSLSANVLARLAEEVRSAPPRRRASERRKRIESLLDAGHGSCVLRAPPVGALVQASFLYHDAGRYHLLAWVVMPNHVHVLFEPLTPWTVARIVASWKSYTGRRIAKYLDREEGRDGAWESRTGRKVWQREYWDRFIRNERHLQAAIDYIHQNPVMAGLVGREEEWAWSSARLKAGG